MIPSPLNDLKLQLDVLIILDVRLNTLSDNTKFIKTILLFVVPLFVTCGEDIEVIVSGSASKIHLNTSVASMENNPLNVLIDGELDESDTEEKVSDDENDQQQLLN